MGPIRVTGHITIRTCPDLTIVTVTGVLDLVTDPQLEVELATAHPELPLIVDYWKCRSA